MKIMRLYKHTRNTDVAILVLKSFFVAQSNVYKLKIKWMNIVNPKNIFYTGIHENLKIDAKVFHKDWELIG